MNGAGKLVICPTPLGNLGDMTLRGIEMLQSADVVCSEDTRVTSKLLAAYDIQKRLERLDEAMISRGVDSILDRIRQGQTVVFCSDAGMPGVSDPGSRLINAVQSAGLPVTVLPGPSAGVTAYVASGFTNQNFYFGGFFPRKANDQEKLLLNLKNLDAALVFYESPTRLVAALRTIAKCFPDREVAVCRELTKMHEEVVRAIAPQVLGEFESRIGEKSLRGEIVVVINGPSAAEKSFDAGQAFEKASEKALQLKTEGVLSKKDMVAYLQEEFGIARNAAYEIVHGS